jgi:CDP-glucose 4,6-dehydratase
MDDLNFFRGRQVFITGHTGFKGSWLALWLLRRGALVSGYSLDVPTTPSLFETLGLAEEIRHFAGDVRDAEYLTRVLESEQPEIVFHLAAQPLVRRGFRHPKQTFDVNVGGTVNLLEAVRQTKSVRGVICVTSDKCYDPRGWEWGQRENDQLGGVDPYGASKAAAELVAAAYRESYFSASQPFLTAMESVEEESLSHTGGIGLATVRAGNVIGGGDWAEDRLVPDCIRALVADEPISIRRPESTRPWQHVLEPLAGYLILAKRLYDHPRRFSGAWNFGPSVDSARSVAEMVHEITRFWGYGQWIRTVDHQLPEAHERDHLRLCSDKAISLLNWRPQWNLSAALKRTVEWYRAYYWHGSGPELRGMSERQIRQYELGSGLSSSTKSRRIPALAESPLR